MSKENENIKMVIKEGGKLSTYTIEELLSYKDAVDMVYRHYDNLARIEMTDKANDNVFDKLSKYEKLKAMIFNEIIKRVDSI